MAERVPYNLSATSAHDAFVFFDNADREDRLTILVTIRKLHGAEFDEVSSAVVAWHGEGALRRRNRDKTSELEYMKYCIIMHGDSKHIIDMDTLRDVDPDASQKKLAACDARCCEKAEGEASVEEGKPLNVGFLPHHGTVGAARREVAIETQKHGRITLHFQTFEDPDIRNSINITVQRNLKIDTCWGASVKAVNPKLFRRRRWFKRPIFFSQGQIRMMHENDTYWQTLHGKAEWNKEMVSTPLAVPRRGSLQIQALSSGRDIQGG